MIFIDQSLNFNGSCTHAGQTALNICPHCTLMRLIVNAHILAACICNFQICLKLEAWSLHTRA
jgi:hypothetical protein